MVLAVRGGSDGCGGALWGRDGQVLAVGLVDGPGSCDWRSRQAEHDRSGPPDGRRREPAGARRPAPGEGLRRGEIRRIVPGAAAQGRVADEPWTPLQRDLAVGRGLRRAVRGDRSEAGRVRSAVQRAAFERSTFAEDRWHAMASGPAYQTPGVSSPMTGTTPRWRPQRCGRPAGARAARADGRAPRSSRSRLRHGDHRRRSATRGNSARRARSCVPRGSNVGAVATYGSAGFRQLPDVRTCAGPP